MPDLFSLYLVPNYLFYSYFIVLETLINKIISLNHSLKNNCAHFKVAL